MTIQHPADARPGTRYLWTRADYDRLIEAGVFGPGDRVELIEGEILNMAPQHAKHATGIRLVERCLHQMIPKGVDVRCQLPLALGERSEPEPDVAVVRGNVRDYSEQHPDTAELIVEVAETSLEVDRTRKLEIYAANGIQEYWILNLEDRQLEVYRRPNPATRTYEDRTLLKPDSAVPPLFSGGSAVTIAELLP